MNLRNPRVQMYILLGLAGATVVYGYLGTTYLPFCYPSRRAVLAELRETSDKLERELVKDRAAVRERPRLEAQVASLTTRWAVERAVVPLTSPPDEVLREVSVAAQEANVVITAMRPQPSRNTDSYIIFPASLDVSGRYSDVAMFLEKIASCQRLLVIPKMTLSGDDKSQGGKSAKSDTPAGDRGSVRATMQLVAYSQKGGAK